MRRHVRREIGSELRLRGGRLHTVRVARHDATRGLGTCDTPASGCTFDLETTDTCGSCDVACTTAMVCDLGTCRSTCSDARIPCDKGKCIDPKISVSNCGGCGIVCAGPIVGTIGTPVVDLGSRSLFFDAMLSGNPNKHSFIR